MTHWDDTWAKFIRGPEQRWSSTNILGEKSILERRDIAKLCGRNIMITCKKKQDLFRGNRCIA